MIGWATNRWRSIWRVGLRRRSAASFLLAIACVAIGTAVRMGLGLISPDSAVFASYYSATLVAALVGGAEAGGVAAVLGGIAAWQLFVPPDWDLASFRLEQLVSFVLYGTSSGIIIWAAESYRGLLERLRQEQAARQLLNLELVHRMKNMLATVQAILCHSLRDQDALLETVTGRLAVLGATNELLVESGRQGAALGEILARELAPYGLSRCRLQGDDVDCPHAMAVTLALIFHELTTNAAKYGALSVPQGCVDVTWSVDAGRLDLVWMERGGPPPAAPKRKGFGSKLLRSGVKQFRGDMDCEFEPTGLRCRLSLSVPGRAKDAVSRSSEVAAFEPHADSSAETRIS